MPDTRTLKLQGTKLVPVNRFNLEASKPSTSFKGKGTKQFSVIKHPVVTSVQIKPLIAILLNKDYFPLIESSNSINENSKFKDYSDSKINLCFPQIEIAPINNTLFYYENILNAKGENSDLAGHITLQYKEKNQTTSTTQQNIELSLKEAILNLKVKGDTVKINGVVNTVKKEITFQLKNEAVKIAFSNLTTNIEDLKCNIDLFFEFKGYSKFKKNFVFAKDFKFNTAFLNTSIVSKTNLKSAKMLITPPLMINKNVATKSTITRDIRTIQLGKKLASKDTAETPEFVKNTFLLKINKQLHYPIAADPKDSLYKTVDGGFIINPFNLNEGFSQYEQIFVPGINFDKLSIYKSTTTANEFLLIAKRYTISRDTDTMKPCIETIFHAYEDGTGLTEDISKINFQFALGPNLSEYDLTKLKIDLKNNNFLDGNHTNFLNEVRFIYPTDINADYEINGNHLLKDAEITVDGKHFLVSLTTENINEASILINAINNAISQYANINFKHKEIKDTAVIEINLEKTIGEIVQAKIQEEVKKIEITNVSISKCKLNSVLTVDSNNAIYNNNSFFSSYPLLDSGQSLALNQIDLNQSFSAIALKNVFFDFESIENISEEFNQIVSSSTSYNRYAQVQIQNQDSKITKVQIKLTVKDTRSMFTIEKLKTEFNKPILFNFIIKNTAVLNTIIACEVNYYDLNENIIANKSFDFNFSDSATINIPKHNS